MCGRGSRILYPSMACCVPPSAWDILLCCLDGKIAEILVGLVCIGCIREGELPCRLVGDFRIVIPVGVMEVSSFHWFAHDWGHEVGDRNQRLSVL